MHPTIRAGRSMIEVVIPAIPQIVVDVFFLTIVWFVMGFFALAFWGVNVRYGRNGLSDYIMPIVCIICDCVLSLIIFTSSVSSLHFINITYGGTP